MSYCLVLFFSISLEWSSKVSSSKPKELIDFEIPIFSNQALRFVLNLELTCLFSSIRFLPLNLGMTWLFSQVPLLDFAWN